jgi:hypothetical protein
VELASDICRDILRRYAALSARLSEELGERPMVLPTGAWFPDRFAGDQDSVERLLARMQTHAGMDDIPIAAELVRDEDDEQPQGGSCSACVPKASGATPGVRDEGSRWVIAVPATDLAHPVVLTAGLARSLGLVFLLETLPDGAELEQPLDVTVELGAVALGFGALLLEAAYIYAKGCGGPKVARATALSCEELAVAFAGFISVRGERPRTALKALSPTQADALRAACEWLDREGIEPAGPSERELASLAQDLSAAQKKRSAPDPERDALRALVDEAFAEAAPERGT